MKCIFRYLNKVTMPFYAVHKGKTVGVFETWSACKEQTSGFHGARFKKFDTLESAEEFVITGTKNKDGDADTKKVPSKSVVKDNKRKSTDDSTLAPPEKVSKPIVYFEALPGDISKSGKPVVYTDGCCQFNGQHGAKAGLGVYWGPDDDRNVSEPLIGRPTNNRAEIHAARRAVEQAKTSGYKEIILYTDSQFLIKSMTQWLNGWKKKGWITSAGKPVKNKDDFIELDEKSDDLAIQWEYVPGHKGILGNEAADKLAKLGAKSYKAE